MSIAQPGLALSQNLAAALTAHQPQMTLGCLQQAPLETDLDIIAMVPVVLEVTDHIHARQQLHDYRNLLPDLVAAKFPEFGATAPLLIPSTLEFLDPSLILSECCSDHDLVFTRSIVARLSRIP